MSITMEGIVKFNLISDNPFWEPLREAQAHHVTARDRYFDLLALCKSKGVKFSDIKKHLLNEAKKCGLYTRSMWSDTQKTMVYRTWSDLLQCKYSWVIALNNFLSWVSNNFKDYEVRKDRTARKHKPQVQQQTVVRRSTDSAGNVSEVRTETIVETSQVPSAPVEPAMDHLVPGGIVAPVQTDLTVLQKQTLILQNLDILGSICKQKGAVKQFNALMAALEAVEYIIED